MLVEDVPRERLERFAGALSELRRRQERERQAARGGLLEFVRYFWDVIEPQRELVEGWPVEAICEHLEAVTFGGLARLLANVPPGFMKSLLVNVFWPAWEWGPMGLAHMRYVSFSYSAHLTERDNRRFLELLQSRKFQELWGDKFRLRKAGEVLVSNDKTGWKLATSVRGVGTGERGDRILLDDPHNVKEAESEAVRDETVRWFREAMSNRLNDAERGAIVVIMQRVHEADVSGTIISEGFDYCHLMIPMEYDSARHCETEIGWSDPREEDGDLAWPERFTPTSVARDKKVYGPYAYSGQYQQAPTPRGGGIFKRDWWQPWEPADNIFPPFDFVLASLDPAYTEKQENDYSALTIWGVWRDPHDVPKIMLMHAWRKRLELHGRDPEPRRIGESEAEFKRRARKDWGLVEWVADSCRRFKADRLLIEAKASGHSVAQEMRRLHAADYFGVQLVDPGRQDKVARAHSVAPLFADGAVYAPALDGDWRDWVEPVIDEMASFPKGAHDDLVDSATQALRHLRDAGLAMRREEQAAVVEDSMRYRKAPRPLYPV